MEKNKCENRNSPEVRDRAVWVVFEHQGEFDNQSAAIKSIAPKIGCGPDTRQAWVCCADTEPALYGYSKPITFAIDIELHQTKVYIFLSG